MRYECTSAPASDPVTTDEIKTHGDITGSTWDTYLAGLITKATRVIERRLSRQLMTATWVARLDAFTDEIELRIIPVASVTAITYVDSDGTTQTLSASNYQVDCEDPDSPARIRPAYGLVWPSTRGETYNAVTVTFSAGYGDADDVPETYKHAIMLLSQHWFENREPVNIGNIVNALPYSVESLLACDNWGTYA